ncbi:MAG: hypothetical protein AB7J40_05010 [Candidatus Altimarinota bacterium]
MAGFFGGGFGSLVLLIGVLLSGTFASSYLAAVQDGVVHPLFVFATLAVIYLSLLVSSLASLTFFYYCDRERYTYLLSTLSHVFAIITLLFVVSTPLSLLLSLSSFDSLSIIAMVLIALGAIFSVVAMEVVANHKHLLLTLYSSAVALFTFLLFMLIFYFSMGTTTYLLVLALPFCWASFGFWQVSFEMTYQWIYQLYGVDFLNASMRFGSDYVKEQRRGK